MVNVTFHHASALAHTRFRVQGSFYLPRYQQINTLSLKSDQFKEYNTVKIYIKMKMTAEGSL